MRNLKHLQVNELLNIGNNTTLLKLTIQQKFVIHSTCPVLLNCILLRPFGIFFMHFEDLLIKHSVKNEDSTELVSVSLVPIPQIVGICLVSVSQMNEYHRPVIIKSYV